MTIQLFVTLKNFIRACSATGIALLLMLCAYSSSATEPAATQQSTAQVGTVGLLVGKAYLKSPGQSRQRIKSGTQISVSDQITTTANGHVHIHFVDDAYVSVRPDSRLDIISYHYNPRQPQSSEVKFNLEYGITRSISGKAAKAARQRFRLNTPIAAIGVRGTDFVVSATDTTTRALVNEGAIVLAPFSAQCRFDAFGPCNVNAVELTGESLQIAELDGSTTLPRLLATAEIQQPESLRGDVQQAISQQDASADTSESVGSDTYVKEVAAVQVADAATALRPAPVPVVITDFTPEQPLLLADLNDRQLVWGRYTLASGLSEQDRISLSYADASAGRANTVGNTEYGLFRSENGSKRLDKGLTVVGFALSSAQAVYNSDSGVVAMEVKGGSLDIDFQQNNFATELNLTHSATGAVDFFASGRLFDGGYFHSKNDTQSIKGAVSLDGQEAGYLFEQQLLDGAIKGLTLWDSQ